MPNRRTHLLSSFPVLVHDGHYLDHGLSGSCTKEMHAVRKLSVWYKPPSDFKLLSARKIKKLFQKYKLQLIQQLFTLASATSLRKCICREFLKDTTTADNHENVAWKSKFIFFSLSIVIIPTRLLCQMQANSSGARISIHHIQVHWEYEFCHRLFTSFTKRDIRHFHR